MDPAITNESRTCERLCDVLLLVFEVLLLGVQLVDLVLQLGHKQVACSRQTQKRED